MEKLADLLFSLAISSAADNTDPRQLEELATKLTQSTDQNFGVDVERWIAWYMNNVDDADGRLVVQTAHKVYRNKKGLQRFVRNKD